MDPLGIGVAFALFWGIIGLGLFLTFTGFLGLGKAPKVSRIAAQHSATGAIGQLGYAILLLLGLAMVAAGGFAVYAIIYR